MNKYAKLIDGILQFAPKVLRVDGKTYINPQGKTLEQYGYLPLGESIMPRADEGYEVHATGYEVKDGEIVRTWEQVPKPEPADDEEISAPLDNSIKALEARIAALEAQLAAATALLESNSCVSGVEPIANENGTEVNYSQNPTGLLDGDELL